MVAAGPLTVQRTASLLARPLFARTLNLTTSPVRALMVRGSIESPVRLLLTTCTSTLPLPVPDVPVISASPGATPNTTPAASTVATEGLLETQLITTSLRGFPSAPLATVISLRVAPTTNGALTASISMRATGPVLTLTEVNTGLAFTTAPTNTSPGAKNDTLPASSTAARSKGAATHVAAFTSTTFPLASFDATVNFTFCPTAMSLVAGVIASVGAEDD